ncbi:MAG: hypothetical protein KatS3mg081_2018 [Gemmatimonadales bacterium]|nr:MAG: hypothetical protein KatS3mg081_2018 [Gemmatimonadales bacterium]
MSSRLMAILAAAFLASPAAAQDFRFGFPETAAPIWRPWGAGLRLEARDPASWLETTMARIQRARRERWDREIRERLSGERPWAHSRRSAGSQEPELGIAFRGRFELKLDRLRNERCTAADIGNPVSGCREGFPLLGLDQQFNLRAGGTVGERIHVNIDFDSEREFSASNDIRVWYQGQAGELFQRIEVGNVTLDAPVSRFITSAVPANSFGVQAYARTGSLEIRSIVAQQRGSSLRSRVFTIGERTTQPVELELRDIDFEAGRFFWVIDPRTLPGYPDLDVLNLEALALSPSLKPAAIRVYRLRALGGPAGAAPNLGGIPAVAVRPDSPQRVGPFPWELLIEGRDYYVDPSGLWFALANRVAGEDFLAVSYVTAAGDTVGTFPATARGADTLLLIYEPRRGPEVPTFFHEMRQIYRLGGSEIDRSSIEVSVLLDRSEKPVGKEGTYLSLLRLARPTDPSALDQYSRVFPRERDPNGGAPLRDLFLVFPHLLPFADSSRLSLSERNDSLYRTPVHLLATQGPAPRFRIRAGYEATGTGDRSTLNLGALQIREGSERIYLGDRQLVRGRDYDIFYDIGQVVFLNPDALFAGPAARVRVQFEENQLFDVAPKSIVGLTTSYDLGSRGRIDAIGLFQREQTLFTRPQLGFEPKSHFIGGISGTLQFDPQGLTRGLDALPLIETDAPSSLVLNGEIAVSQPNANQAGVAYLEEFEGGAGARAISLSEQAFQLGSMPASGRGIPATHLAPDGRFSPFDAAALVWQNGVEIGGRVMEFEPRDIDSSIVLTGTARQLERVLWLTLKPDTVGGAPDPVTGRPRWIRPHTPGPRWRSISQPLDRSGLGIDLSTVEFLEFWVLEDERRTARSHDALLIFDFGTVLEDALALVPESVSVSPDTVFRGVALAGIGRLDTEKDTITNVFNAQIHDLGLVWDRPDSLIDAATGRVVRNLPLCRGSPAAGLPIFPLGDLAARCTRGNGLLDTEDLNGDNRLDLTVGAAEEHVVRYVVPVGSDRYVVRDGGSVIDGTGRRLTWRLYRVPFRRDTVLIGNPDFRHIAALRITVAVPGASGTEEEIFLALARMRLLGAPWLKRSPTPLAGLAGKVALPRGEVSASVIGTDNRDLGYTSPPGVLDQAAERGLAFQIAPVQINERSLRLTARELRAGERAEAFTRFVAEADRNFLKYRELRVWAQGRGAGWDEGDLEFFVKVGTDEDNFYLYRTQLRAGSWEPELVIELGKWIELRSQIERSWLAGSPPSGAALCGGDSTAYVACDGKYLVQVRDPGIAPPNLARVSELAVGIYRTKESVAADPAEVWIDDIRLSGVVNDPGLAAALDARLVAADVAELAVGWSGVDGRFRQLDEQPGYVGQTQLRLSTTLRLDKLLPGALGLSVPFTVQHLRGAERPFYLRRTDVRASELNGFRQPENRLTSYQLSIRRTTRGEGFLERLLIDPLAIFLVEQHGRSSTELSRSTTSNRQFRVDYNYRSADRRITLSAGTHWLDFDTRRFTFRLPVAAAGDSGSAVLSSITRLWRNRVAAELRPIEPLSFRAEVATARDLQDYGDSTLYGRLLKRERGRILGRDAGFERERAISTGAGFEPRIAAWLRPRVLLTTGFSAVRDPNRRLAVRESPDSSAPLRPPVAASNFQRREIGARFDLAQLAAAGTGSPGATGSALLSLFTPADVSYTLERRSTFDRMPQMPGLDYQLALGGLGSFRERRYQVASTAAETGTLQATGGLRFSASGQLRLSYRNSEGTTWIRRGASQTPIDQASTEWPAGSLNFSFRPPGLAGELIRSLDSRAQFRRSRTSVRQAGVLGSGDRPALTETEATSLAPSISIAWAKGGIGTSAQLNVSQSILQTAGSTTRTDRVEWSAGLAFSVPSPRWLLRSGSPLRASLNWSSSDLDVCLTPAGELLCRSVAESIRRQLDFRIDTGMAENVVGGASLSYIVTDQRHLASRFSQLVLTVFADINLVAGRVP